MSNRSYHPNTSGNSQDLNRSLAPYRESFPAPFQAAPESDFGEDNSNERRLGLGDYWLMVRSRCWMILALAFIVTTVTIIYVARQPDIYEAESRIQVDAEDNPALGATKSGAVIIRAAGDDSSYFNTQLLLLKSPAFLRRVARTLELEKDPKAFSGETTPKPSMWQSIRRMFRPGDKRAPLTLTESDQLRVKTVAPSSPDGEISEAQRLEPFVSSLRSDLDVKLTETTRLINISYPHSNPVMAARVANAVADTFVQASWERRSTTTSTAGEFLQKRIAELQSKIAENEKRLIQYAEQHQIFPLDSGRDIQSDRLAALDKDLLEAEKLRKIAESEYTAALAPGAAAAMVEVANSPQLSVLDGKLAEMRQRKAVMLIDAGENWPEVKELNKQISLLEEQLKQTRENAIRVTLTNLETKYREAVAREQALRKSFEEQHTGTMNQKASEIDYRLIQQENVTYNGLLDSLLQRSKENDVILAATPNNVHVTDYSTLPRIPVAPRRLRIVALAFAASLGFGIGFAILLGRLEDSVRVDSKERVENMFALPALSVVPDAKRRQLLPRQALQRRNGNGRTGLLLDAEMSSPLAESFRKLRTSLVFSIPKRSATTLLVTSSLPGEGKSTAVVNTGLIMSQNGAKILLIDGDLRHPTLHKLLDLENETGLSTLLAGDSEDVDPTSAMQRYGDTNLYVIPSGPIPGNPSELLSSERLSLLLEKLSGDFSRVIIDSPPVGFFSDALIISSVVDGVIMVVRGPKTPRQVARYTMQSLDEVGAPILGVVLNAVTLHMKNYSYYRNQYT